MIAYRAARLVFASALLGQLSLTASAEGDRQVGFGGAFLQLGAGVVDSSTEIGYRHWFNAEPRDQSAMGEIEGGYGWDLGRFGLRVAGFYDLGRQSAGKTRQNSPFVAAELGDTVEMTLSRTCGVVLEPGFRVTDSVMLYTQLGYGWTSGESTFSRPFFSDRFSSSNRYDGFLWGLGVQYAWNSNFYGFAQFRHTLYRGRTVQDRVETFGVTKTYPDYYKPESLSMTVGVGYRF